MSTTEGHYCGPKPCPECGEVHGCVCGNCMTEPCSCPRGRPCYYCSTIGGDDLSDPLGSGIFG